MAEKDIFYIKIAGLCVEMRARYPYSRAKCRDYICEGCERPDVVSEASFEEIEAERAVGGGNFPPDYCEFICLYRAIAERLPDFDRFVFHGAAISDRDSGIIFTAPSGTGKSTHISLWRQVFGDEVEVVNGDKPIISLSGGTPMVFGTPWSGKEGWQSNISRRLDAICILFRGEENCISPASPEEYFDTLIRQIYLPRDGEARLKTLELIGKLAELVGFYRLDCNTSPEAARVAREGIAH